MADSGKVIGIDIDELEFITGDGGGYGFALPTTLSLQFVQHPINDWEIAFAKDEVQGPIWDLILPISPIWGFPK